MIVAKKMNIESPCENIKKHFTSFGTIKLWGDWRKGVKYKAGEGHSLGAGVKRGQQG